MSDLHSRPGDNLGATQVFVVPAARLEGLHGEVQTNRAVDGA